jgi:adenylylsulfate kinase-like enzyme
VRYEAPADAEIVIDTEQLTPEQAAQEVIAKLEQLGLVGSEVRA